MDSNLINSIIGTDSFRDKIIKKYCRKKETLSSMAKKFGVKISGFTMSRHRFENQIKIDKQTKYNLKELEELLKKESNKVEVRL